MNAFVKKVSAALILGFVGLTFDHFGQHLVAIMCACSAANALWYDPPEKK